MARRTLLDHIKAWIGETHAQRLTRRFFKAVARATATQDELLAALIARGSDSDFGREHHFGKIRNYADFKANVPIRGYVEMTPYIERVRRGEVGALFRPNEKILMFALTSGTTAEPKYIPITPQVLADSRRGWNIWGVKALLDHDGCLLRHIVQITSPMNDHLAPSGIPCGAITGLLAATQKKVVLRYYTSPAAVSRIEDSSAKYYTIMRLAIPRDVAWIVTANPATLLLLAKTADEERERIIRDIRDGTLSKDVPVDDDIRVALAPRLKPDPTCARRLERIVAEYGAMYPRHYWNLGYRAHWTGGTMGLYEAQFPRYYGDAPVRDIGLIASEGRMSIPVEDGTASGILAVTSQFFEFIPAKEYGAAADADGSKRPWAGAATLRSHEVVEGEEYFLVLTNSSGLYRYDMGDRVRITGWVGQAPLIEFLSRDAHTASMAGEKLTEDQVVMAMRKIGGNVKTSKRQNGGKRQKVKKSKPARANHKAADGIGGLHRQKVKTEATGEGATGARAEGVSIVNFVLSPQWGETPRYRLYVETADVGRNQDLALRFDAALCEISVEYAQKRGTLRLAGVELGEMPDGFLVERDRRLRRQRTRTAEQFKHQYLLPRPGLDADMQRPPPTCNGLPPC